MSDFATAHISIDIDLTKSSEGYWIAVHPTLLMHGTGDTVAAAIFDFLSVASEMYADLASSEHILGYHLQEQLKILRSIGTMNGVGGIE